MLSDPYRARGFVGLAWQTLRRSRWSQAAMTAGAMLVGLAVFAPLLASDRPFLWRVDDGPWQSPWCAGLFDRTVFESPIDVVANSLLFPGSMLLLLAIVTWRTSRTFPRATRHRRRRKALACSVGAWVCACIFLISFSEASPKRVYTDHQAQLERAGHRVVAIYPPLPYAVREPDLASANLGPCLDHPLGTDDAGRDVLTRLLFGARVSLSVGLLAVATYVLLGVIVGAVAGYFGGLVDAVVLRVVEVFMSIPSLFLVLCVASLIDGRSLLHVIGIIAAVRWTGPARLVRAEILRLRRQRFVVAAEALGSSAQAIIVRELLPNALSPVLVSTAFGVAASILLEATMSFLGLGDPTLPSWGQLLSTGRATGSWPLIIAPGLLLFVTVGALHIIGEALSDALDPTKGRADPYGTVAADNRGTAHAR